MRSGPALGTDHHRTRRWSLAETLDAAVLLMGNGTIPRNIPINLLPFRQDSNFLYFTGCDLPGAAALIIGERCELFLPLPAEDDAIWHGETPGVEALRVAYGVDAIRDAQELAVACGQVPGPLMTLAVSDPTRCALAAELAKISLSFGDRYGSRPLAETIIEMRRVKHPVEVAEHRKAVAVTEAAHRAAMAATHVGGHEREIAALFDAVVASRDCVPGYGSIVTVRGDILHNPHYDHGLEGGDLLLLDGGAERRSGYGADVTRTWPVSGRFEPRAKAAYEAVLESQRCSIALCQPGTRYRDIHLESARVLTRWLIDEGLLTCGVDEALETGAHAMFYPHGVGHLLGLDVHDLEGFGDLAGYAPDRERDEVFGISYLRLDQDLVPGNIVTIEPGFYVVPNILSNAAFRQQHASRLDFEKAASWIGFGGIRIEDNVLITAEGPDVHTESIPKTVSDLEELVGSGQTVSERFAG